MSREIRFRVWNSRNKQFIRPDQILVGDGYIVQHDGGGENFAYLKDFYTEQQFTGLIDSKGKEIYEGDIVNIDFGKLENRGIGKIVYWKCGFIIMNKYGATFQDTIPSLETGEIIGNIFENPKLLGENQCKHK